MRIYDNFFGIYENKKLGQTLNWVLVLVLSCDFICGGCSATVAAARVSGNN